MCNGATHSAETKAYQGGASSTAFSTSTSESSFASASCAKSAFKQNFTNTENSYSADQFTYKKSENSGKSRISKIFLWHSIIRIKRSCMKKLTVYLN